MLDKFYFIKTGQDKHTIKQTLATWRNLNIKPPQAQGQSVSPTKKDLSKKSQVETESSTGLVSHFTERTLQLASLELQTLGGNRAPAAL